MNNEKRMRLNSSKGEYVPLLKKKYKMINLKLFIGATYLNDYI